MSLSNGDKAFQREAFASHPDRVLVIRLTSSKPGAITFRMSFGGGVIPASVKTVGNDTLVLDGHAWEHMHSSGHDGVALQIRVCAIIEGGDSTAGNQAIQIRGADAAIILVAIGTSFNGEDPEAMSREIIKTLRARITPGSNKITLPTISRCIVEHRLI